MKIFMELMSGEKIELTEAESVLIGESGNSSKLINLKRLNRTFAVHQIKDIKSIAPGICVQCGAEIYGDSHYCTYKGLDAVVKDRGRHSPNLEKLREQVRLVKSGKPAREAYQIAWGKELPSDELSFSERRDIANGQAKLLYTEDGIPYVGYNIDEVNREYARQCASWANFKSYVRDEA